MSSSPKLAKQDPWGELTKTALLGTERAPFTPVLTNSEADPLFMQIDSAKREQAVLAAAAVLSTYRRSGVTPAKATGKTPEQAAEETLPRCSPAASSLLKRTLQSQFSLLLPEFLEESARAKKRVPEELLPAVLEAAKKDSSIRPHLAGVVGNRGLWLASLNPEWSFISAASSTADWETASRVGRVALLRQTRREEPSKAIELMQSTWKQDGPEDRIAFTTELSEGLSASDEPFLEIGLDDKRKEVRQRAADLLLRLPTSAIVARMQERAAQIVKLSSSGASKFKKLIGKGPQIEIELPAAWDSDWLRDGIEQKSPTGKGEKAWWLHQIVSAVPVAFWQQHLGMAPNDCVDAAAASDYAYELLTGWAASTVRHRDALWAKAILAHALKSERNNRLLAVIAVLESPDRDPVLIELLKKDRDKLGYEHPGLNLLQSTPGPWSTDLGKAVISLLRYHVEQISAGKIQYIWHWFRDPEEFAKKMPLNLADEVEEDWGKDPSPALMTPVKRFQEVLLFRSKMHKEIHQ